MLLPALTTIPAPGTAKILFGKPIYYSDVYIDEPKKFKDFVEELNGLCLADEEKSV